MPAGNGGGQVIVTAPGDSVVVARTLSVYSAEPPPMGIAFVSVEFVRVNAAAVVEMLRPTFACVTGGAPSSAAATVSVFVPAVIEVGVRTVMVELPTPGVSIG